MFNVLVSILFFYFFYQYMIENNFLFYQLLSKTYIFSND